MPSVRALRLALAIAGGAAVTSATATAQPAELWEIGPILRSRNYSVGMPPSPFPAGRGWYFNFPGAGAGHVSHVTFKPGPLLGRSRIVVRYRIDAGRGVRFASAEPSTPATLSLILQRRGDNWSGRRQYEYFRWYAPRHSVRALARGEHEISVRLDDPSWTSVLGVPAAATPAAFRDALADPARVGLVFGTANARGHGVHATGPARFTLLSFRVE